MLAIPAIDLGGARDAAGTGTAGEGPERADDPRDVARRWVAAGFSRFHLMDLDAESDRDESRHLVRDLLRDMQEVGGVTVQVGGSD